MKTSLLVAGILAATTILGATPAAAERVNQPTRPGTTGNEFVISCYRGPWKAVSWDRPNAVFIDELVEYGYTPGQSIAIGTRVCRDEYGVDNPEYMKATLLKLIAEQPPLRLRGTVILSD